MSWLFSRALVEEFSPGIFLDGELCAQWNVTPTPQGFWRNDKMMGASHLSRFGPTLQLLTADHGGTVLTSFLAAFPARTSVPREVAPESRESVAGCGLSSLESLAKYDQGSSSWRIPQLSLLGGWDEFSETWPRWGLMRDGECWVRSMSGLRTGGTESGLWPTPTVCGNHNRPGASSQAGWGLSSAVKLWGTPTANMGAKGGGRHKGPNGPADTLASQVAEAENLPVSSTGQLNPEWVEWLMGWPRGWTDLRPLEMGKFQEWRQQHLPRVFDD